MLTRFFILVETAKLHTGGGLFKPNPYVELSVDGKASKKTEVEKGTYTPSWNEPFTL